MTNYLINMYQPIGPIPPPDVLDRVMADLAVINDEIRERGQWVFSGALHPPLSSTVVRAKDGQTLMTDGPFAEVTEHIGGFWVVDAPDLDAALGWATRITGVTTLPTEVRPFSFVRL